MNNQNPAPPSFSRIDLTNVNAVKQWCEYFGITTEQLTEAVKAAGTQPAVVREHLLNQGASAGAG